MDGRELVDITEAERITTLDRSTIYRLSRSGQLRSFRVLNTLRFDRRDLMGLVTERTDRNADTAEGEGR